jgi:hypothetical protein
VQQEGEEQGVTGATPPAFTAKRSVTARPNAASAYATRPATAADTQEGEETSTTDSRNEGQAKQAKGEAAEALSSSRRSSTPFKQQTWDLIKEPATTEEGEEDKWSTPSHTTGPGTKASVPGFIIFRSGQEGSLVFLSSKSRFDS